MQIGRAEEGDQRLDRVIDHSFTSETGWDIDEQGGEASPEAATEEIPVAVFNVKFSPNLGDGVIADCLEHALIEADPRLRPYSIDLAGRLDHHAGNGRNRRGLIRLIESLPPAFRRLIVPMMLGAVVRLRLRPLWREQLAPARMIILGGGNLLADRDQNFPIKVAAALGLAKERSLPVALASLGVGAHWSNAGVKRMREAIGHAEPLSITLRDRLSIGNWNATFARVAGTSSPELAHDPGLLAEKVYGRHVAGGFCDRIGICVTAPEVLRLHGAPGSDRCDAVWMEQLVERLSAAGQELVLFTNGSQEDERFLDEVCQQLMPNAGVTRAPRFTRPRDLARFIGSLRSVVAHRLHACIIAHSYGLPAVGLAWDAKLQGFFDTIGRAQYLLDPAIRDPGDVAAAVLNAMNEPPQREDVDILQAECRASIADLAVLAIDHAVSA